MKCVSYHLSTLTQNRIVFSIFCTDSEICPVGLFELYLEKLNRKRFDLWQRPKRKIRGPELEWFDNQVIGRDPLNEMMKQLSKDAKLSMIYTNHSIRATCLTKLDEAGFEIRHIQAVSGHKSEESIKSYAKRCPENKKRDMSTALNLESAAKRTKTASISTPQDVMPNFDIVDFIPIDNNADDFDLSSIINEVSNENTANFLGNDVPTNAIALKTTESPAVVQSENAAIPSTQMNNNVVQNFNNHQMHPFVPKMIFNNSSVTINYNFGKN